MRGARSLPPDIHRMVDKNRLSAAFRRGPYLKGGAFSMTLRAMDARQSVMELAFAGHSNGPLFFSIRESDSEMCEMFLKQDVNLSLLPEL